ncbi:hypothetical protein ES703_117289 [subsurface metagenome]
MAGQVRWLKLAVILTVLLSLAIVILVPSPMVSATTSEARTGGIPLSIQDLSAVPQSIVDDAARLATELFGNGRGERHDFINQLLATYLVAKDKDIVMFFNSGGWGWTLIGDSPEAQSFVTGIECELASLGYTSLMLNHNRTVDTLNGRLSEVMLAVGLYPLKAKDLASRVEFLTNHIPSIKVILTGVSNGTLICESVMNILRDIPQVYSIQLGPPFWSNNIVSDRSLAIRSNGIVPDSFSQGDLFTIIRASLESLFGIAEDDAGHILLHIGAPGHDYQWQYPEVRSRIISFLQQNFGLK